LALASVDSSNTSSSFGGSESTKGSAALMKDRQRFADNLAR
jgi:hypothetical protein